MSSPNPNAHDTELAEELTQHSLELVGLAEENYLRSTNNE
jgi:hypothetical protein